MEEVVFSLKDWSKFLPKISLNPFTDPIRNLLEIVILSFLIYEILAWIRDSRAWTLLRGIVVILLFTAFAEIAELNTILWIIYKSAPTAIIAVMIIFQPELRRALEQLGSKNILTTLALFDDTSKKEAGQFTDKTINELVRASFEMGKVCTGALMVIERETSLKDIEKTGIEVDGLITSQLLINIFEHNTPLHDGAVVIRGNRVVAATCYLPLSDNMMISKELGTRHRAAVGVSEVTDSITVVVSEETGYVSVAKGGHLTRNMTQEELREELSKLKTNPSEPRRFGRLKGRLKNERKADE